MKNYTSEVTPATSIARIEELLIAAGARQIAREYNGAGEVTALSFSIKNAGSERPIYVRMPADAGGAFNVLKGLYRKPENLTTAQINSLKEQAKRTAWKLVWDWIAVQLSMVEMRQAEMAEIFLPYIVVGANELTFYKQLRANRVGMLGYEPKAKSAEEEEPANA